MSTRSTRAAPLPPDERRAAIVAAALPLVRKHGYAVTTRQIAAAADVAEGTIFRVFDDKAAIVDAVVRSVFDPTVGVAAFDAVDRRLPLETRVHLVFDMLSEGMRAVWELMAAVAATRQGDPVHADTRAKAWRDGRLIVAAAARVFEPDAHRLAVTPEQAAVMINGIAVASMQAARLRDRDDEDRIPFGADEVTRVLVHGLLHRPDEAGLAAALLGPDRDHDHRYQEETAPC